MIKLLTIILILSTTLINTALSQISELDNNYGFKSYKFNVSKSAYKEYEFSKTKDYGAEKCKINIKEYIGDIPTNEIYLFFVNDKLAKIEVCFPSYSVSVKSILDACISAFGEPNRKKTETPLVVNGKKFPYDQRYYWYGKKVNLTCEYVEKFQSIDYPLGNKLEYARRPILIFELANYKNLKKNYKTKKYTSNDF